MFTQTVFLYIYIYYRHFVSHNYRNVFFFSVVIITILVTDENNRILSINKKRILSMIFKANI